MAENSKIEWTDHTFNPWMGCTKVSNGCKHCYAEALMDKRWGKAEWGPSGKRIRTSEANWKKPYQWDRQAQKLGVRYRVFCASLSDVFEDKPDQQQEMDTWRSDLFAMIQATKNLDWLLLTKRPENVNATIERVTGFSDAEMWFYTAGNVWIGTSVEDQATADERIPHLLQVPAAVRFLSMEPLLDSVDLENWLFPDISHPSHGALIGDSLIDWVIIGGESGHGARPFSVLNAGRIIRDCKEAGVTVFMKQLGEFEGKRMGLKDKKGGDWDEWTEGLRVREFPMVEAVTNA